MLASNNTSTHRAITDHPALAEKTSKDTSSGADETKYTNEIMVAPEGAEKTPAEETSVAITTNRTVLAPDQATPQYQQDKEKYTPQCYQFLFDRILNTSCFIHRCIMTPPLLNITGYFISQLLSTLYGVSKALGGIPLINDYLKNNNIAGSSELIFAIWFSALILVIQSVASKATNKSPKLSMLNKQLCMPHYLLEEIKKIKYNPNAICQLQVPSDHMENAQEIVEYIYKKHNIPTISINEGKLPENILNQAINPFLYFWVLCDAACILAFTPTLYNHGIEFFHASSATASTTIVSLAIFGSICGFWNYFSFRIPKAILGYRFLTNSNFSRL